MILFVNTLTDQASLSEPAMTNAHFVSGDLSLTSDPFPATLQGEFLELDPTVEAPWLQAILQYLPTLLPSLEGDGRTERLEQLAQLTYPGLAGAAGH